MLLHEIALADDSLLEVLEERNAVPLEAVLGTLYSLRIVRTVTNKEPWFAIVSLVDSRAGIHYFAAADTCITCSGIIPAKRSLYLRSHGRTPRFDSEACQKRHARTLANLKERESHGRGSENEAEP